MRVAGKGDEIERVRRIKIVERQLHRLLRFLDWKSFHRAGSIENEDQLFRSHIINSNALGWLKNEREEVSFLAFIRQPRVLNRLARYVVTQNKISVGNSRVIFESQVNAAWVSTIDVDCMCLRFDVVDDQTGV